MENVTKNIGFLIKQELINKVEQKLPNSTREEDYWIYKFNKEPHRLEREQLTDNEEEPCHGVLASYSWLL